MPNKRNKHIVICITLFFLFSLCSCKNFELDVHIFSNIQECQSIEKVQDKSAVVTRYDSPIRDEYLKDLQFEDFYGCKYDSNDLKFELFAYAFPSNDVAMSYFENVTGKTNDPNPTFSSSSGMVSYIRVVVNENMAYTVNCKKEYEEKVIEFLNGCFSVDILGEDK